MRKTLALWLAALTLAGCGSDNPESSEPITRTVLEKYEQGGKHYVSVTGPSGSIIQVEVAEQRWKEMRRGGTVSFDKDWDIAAIGGP